MVFIESLYLKPCRGWLAPILSALAPALTPFSAIDRAAWSRVQRCEGQSLAFQNHLVLCMADSIESLVAIRWTWGQAKQRLALGKRLDQNACQCHLD